MKVAAIQMTSTRDVRTNLAEAGRLLGEAAARGAELAVLPENFSFMGATEAEKHRGGRARRRRSGASVPRGAGGETSALARRRHDPHSRRGRRQAPRRARCSIGPDGREIARYDKIHLFDVDIPGREAERYLESASARAGTRVVTAGLPSARLGMTVCYDIRFPALFHRLSVLGTDVLVVPAAFTVPTGEVHWRPLLQARAIESLVYVVAAAQCGEHAGGRKTYGHSLIVAPWGEILGELGTSPGVLVVDLDMIRLRQLREKFPVIHHRREL